jgi:solute:Na+ symporter, SSS family
VTISENIIKGFLSEKNLTDRHFLAITRGVVVVFSVGVVLYALWSLEHETSIHSMVENAYKVTLATAFVPLVAGLFWKRANNTGATASILLGLATWLGMELVAPEGALPPQFAGFIASTLGMVIGSHLKDRPA